MYLLMASDCLFEALKFTAKLWIMTWDPEGRRSIAGVTTKQMGDSVLTQKVVTLILTNLFTESSILHSRAKEVCSSTDMKYDKPTGARAIFRSTMEDAN